MEDRELVRRALSGEPAATRSLVRAVLSTVQARIARVLVRRRHGVGRDVRQEVEDIAQEVFASLFENDGRVLRAWDPARGLSLVSFCGLIAEREAASILRSGKRSPWAADPTDAEELEESAGSDLDVEARVATRQQLELLIDRLRESVSPLGLQMFELLVVREESVETVCAATGMTAGAVYAWKSRIRKLVHRLAFEL